MDTNNGAVPTGSDGAADNEAVVNEGQENNEGTKTEGTEVQAKAQAVKNLKKFKLKVDGQEIEEEIDLNDEETIKRHLQMSKAANKRMSEAAKARQQAETIIHAIRTDLKGALSNPDALGLKREDVRKIAEELLAEELENEMLSPEQKELKELRKQVAERKAKEQEAEKERIEKESIELQQRYADDYDKKISEALNTSGLPKTAKTVKRMAQLMYQNLEHGYELEPKHLVDIVREEYLQEIKELFSASDADAMLKLMGDDVANKIRKADLARLRQIKPEFKKPEPLQEEDRPQRKKTTEEWLAEARKRARS